MNYQDVTHFWFDELTPKQWWVQDDSIDELIRQRFESLHIIAAKGELFSWRGEAEGWLAEIIVLDQFSRNIHRGSPLAFAYDDMALELAKEAVANSVDQKLVPGRQAFLYMPYMHSESKAIHEEAVRLFSQPGMENNLEFEYKHKVIIDRFSRYPHRNKILGRESTPEEIELLKQPDSAF